MGSNLREHQIQRFLVLSDFTSLVISLNPFLLFLIISAFLSPVLITLILEQT